MKKIIVSRISIAGFTPETWEAKLWIDNSGFGLYGDSAETALTNLRAKADCEGVPVRIITPPDEITDADLTWEPVRRGAQYQNRDEDAVNTMLGGMKL